VYESEPKTPKSSPRKFVLYARFRQSETAAAEKKQITPPHFGRLTYILVHTYTWPALFTLKNAIIGVSMNINAHYIRDKRKNLLCNGFGARASVRRESAMYTWKGATYTWKEEK
jgi:hypothetical protein